MRTVDLFCLPFAGGNKYSYRVYEEKAPSWLRVIPLEYPGRGARSREGLLTNMEAMVDDIYAAIKKEIRRDYVIYGHSMGALVAYLLVRKLTENGHSGPLHLFITGTTGPSAYVKEERKRHLLSKQGFIEELKVMDGCPEEILGNDEMLNYFEPILRADFKAAETYVYEEKVPLDMPLTVITGTEEDMKKEDIDAWQKETIQKIDLRKMQGKHFFIFNHADKIMEIIIRKIFHPNKIDHI
jgi:surfactin synthase thioesterase subunit